MNRPSQVQQPRRTRKAAQKRKVLDVPIGRTSLHSPVATIMHIRITEFRVDVSSNYIRNDW